jgi:hypothetical protein
MMIENHMIVTYPPPGIKQAARPWMRVEGDASSRIEAPKARRALDQKPKD